MGSDLIALKSPDLFRHASHAARRRSHRPSVGLLILAAHLATLPTVVADTALPADNVSAFTAEQRAHWAFLPIVDAPLPAVQATDWPTSPIDRFILHALEANGLSPAPRADKRTLIRRVTFDLTGLPPTPSEIAAFLHDKGPDAFEKVVERLLASPRYGERWGRHWLDIARFAETAAHDGNNAYLHAWRYRDYVVEAFNADKPYDTFIVEQLAGDLLPADGDARKEIEQLIATGFLQIGPKPVVMRDKRQMLLDIADEQIQATGIAFMGLTLGCARCHDHKFDPVGIRDYYSLAGVFLSTRVMADAAPDSMWLEFERRTPDGQAMKVMAVEDHEQPADVHVHLRGNYRTLGEITPRRYLPILAGEAPPPLDTTGSGRLEWAQWLASADHPLTSRVMVNRIWQHHFGTGVVASSDNFGMIGEKPSHPALLDWLATRFVESGWSIKAMHRMMVLSSTYAQASAGNAAARNADPQNRLLWQMPRRRLSAEEVRDAMLSVCGTLDRRMGGTLFTTGYTPVDARRELFTVDISGDGAYEPFLAPRRSLYLPMLRNSLPPMLSLFDAANEHEPCTRRSQTTVAPQALFLMNNPFVRQQALAMATALTQLPGIHDNARVRIAYEKTLGRPPTTQETDEARSFLEQYVAAIDPDGSRQRAMTARRNALSKPYAQQVDETPGLLAYYQFDEFASAAGQGSAVRNSRPGPGAKGVYVDGVSRAGAIEPSFAGNTPNTALALNGVNQRVEVNDITALNRATRQLTVEYWTNPDSVQTAMIIGRDHAGSGARYWKSGIIPRTVGGEEKNVVFYEFFDRGGFLTKADDAYVAEVGQWTHVAFTYGNGKRQLYINGKLVDQQVVQGDILSGPAPLTLGSRHDDKEWFQGRIDEVAIYDRVLTANQIRLRVEMGNVSARTPLVTPRQHAWQGLCQALLCMNEFIYLD